MIVRLLDQDSNPMFIDSRTVTHIWSNEEGVTAIHCPTTGPGSYFLVSGSVEQVAVALGIALPPTKSTTENKP